MGQQFGASTSTIIRRFDEIAKRELKDIEQLPRVIAIDEYKGDTKEGKYQLIIANGETKEPIDILPNRRKRTIVNYLRKYGANVQNITVQRILDRQKRNCITFMKRLKSPVFRSL